MKTSADYLDPLASLPVDELRDTYGTPNDWRLRVVGASAGEGESDDDMEGASAHVASPRLGYSIVIPPSAVVGHGFAQKMEVHVEIEGGKMQLVMAPETKALLDAHSDDIVACTRRKSAGLRPKALYPACIYSWVCRAQLCIAARFICACVHAAQVYHRCELSRYDLTLGLDLEANTHFLILLMVESSQAGWYREHIEELRKKGRASGGGGGSVGGDGGGSGGGDSDIGGGRVSVADRIVLIVISDDQAPDVALEIFKRVCRCFHFPACVRSCVRVCACVCACVCAGYCMSAGT
jgi:hypothetical protein